MPNFFQINSKPKKGFTPLEITGAKKKRKENKSLTGFTLIEVLVGVTIFLLIAVSVYQGFIMVFEAVRNSRLKITAAAISNEQFEIARNLPYADVGIVAGIPSGKIDRDQIITRDGKDFLVRTTIRNIDDPFDGTLGGVPNDLSPADYKLVELEISCSVCLNFKPLRFTTNVGPKNLESASTNGALFVRVFDANGQPIPGADVHIENNQVVPAIVIDDVTNNDGMLQIVDAPPGIGSYEITVSKPGYSTEKTYPSGGPGNPNPTKPHATVVLQQVTQISFAIDKVSTLNVFSITDTCARIANVAFSIKSSKLIGTSPDVLKYEEDYATNGSGQKIIGNLEWDTYNLSLGDAVYDLAGSMPLLPPTVEPATTLDLQLIVIPKNPRSFLVTVKDAGTQLPISGASVKLEKIGFEEILATGRGFLRQTDWSGGDGQADFIDQTKYFSSDGNIEFSDPAGELSLREISLGQYESTGSLISSFFDTGSASNFYQILWQPQGQPPEVGSDSIRFQLSTNNDKTTWNFLGPDGTASTYYTLADTNINPIHNNDRYLRYKLFLQTADTAFTPILAEVSFVFSSSCTPPGQVIFTNLSSGDYTLTVSKTGYQDFTDTINVSLPWQQREIILTPQ